MSPRPKRILEGAAYVAVLTAAVGGTYLATRGDRAPAAAAQAHDHAAMAAKPAGGARSVALTDDQARRIGVTYAAATVGPLEQEVRTVGQLTWDETRVQAISAKVDGWVERLLVNATGQPVRAGEPLFAIYSPMLVQAQEELLLARRLQRDVAGGTADARKGADDIASAARRRLLYWDVPESEIASLERAGEPRRALMLRSPASGYVLEKSVVLGQRVMAGEPLYKVADLSTVWVEGEVFEQDLASVRLGQMVHADFQALPGEHRMGRISYVYPTVNPETRTARVRVVLPNGDMRLKPGMYATLRIVGAARPAALTVPRGAVLSTGERNVVFVLDSTGRLAPREVSLGVATAERVEILRGLAAGETVVSSATFLVDAESNLGTSLGGTPTPLPMQETGGARPVSVPAAPGAPPAKPAKPAPKPAADPHAGHDGH